MIFRCANRQLGGHSTDEFVTPITLEMIQRCLESWASCQTLAPSFAMHSALPCRAGRRQGQLTVFSCHLRVTSRATGLPMIESECMTTQRALDFDLPFAPVLQIFPDHSIPVGAKQLHPTAPEHCSLVTPPPSAWKVERTHIWLPNANPTCLSPCSTSRPSSRRRKTTRSSRLLLRDLRPRRHASWTPEMPHLLRRVKRGKLRLPARPRTGARSSWRAKMR